MLEGIDLSDVVDCFTPDSPDENIIWGSFDWAESPQGHDYWFKIARFIESKQDEL